MRRGERIPLPLPLLPHSFSRCVSLVSLVVPEAGKDMCARSTKNGGEGLAASHEGEPKYYRRRRISARPCRLYFFRRLNSINSYLIVREIFSGRRRLPQIPRGLKIEFFLPFDFARDGSRFVFSRLSPGLLSLNLVPPVPFLPPCFSPPSLRRGRHGRQFAKRLSPKKKKRDKTSPDFRFHAISRNASVAPMRNLAISRTVSSYAHPIGRVSHTTFEISSFYM